jgi:transposase-like protein
LRLERGPPLASEGAKRRSRSTEEQRVEMPWKADRTCAQEVARMHGVCEQALYIWREMHRFRGGLAEGEDVPLLALVGHHDGLRVRRRNKILRMHPS